jgi:hypothetical protein
MKKTTTPTPTTDITIFKIDLDPQLPVERKELILGGYLPIYKQIQDAENEVASITQADVTVFTLKHAKKAKEVRLNLVKLRGKDGLKGVHDELKLGAKLEGQAIDYLEREPRETLLKWEEQLREIEEFQEREEARRIAELQEARLADLKDYIVDENDPALTTLGEISEEKWEEVFTKYRNAWQNYQEKERLAALRRERLDIAAPYSLYIEEFTETAWEALTDKQFNAIVSEAKAAHEEREREAERLRQELEKQREESAKKAWRFRDRAGRLIGVITRSEGVFYNDKVILTVKSMETWDDEHFEDFLIRHNKQHLEKEEAKRLREESDRKAAEERAAAAARIEEQNRLLREAEEKARKEAAEKEAAIERQKREAEEKARQARTAADYIKLRALAEAFSQVQIPQMSTEKGIATAQKFEEVQQKWVEGMLRLADELEGINEEAF